MAIAKQPSCRLYVILARDGRSAVVFRRGPSKQVQVLRWWLDDDRLEEGQWLKGRIYERRCDLSPDGELLIYFAAKWTGPYQTWTAVSRPPYLSALALWPKGDAWGGGGLFMSSKTIGLNHLSVQNPVSPAAPQPRASWHPLDANPAKSHKTAKPAPLEVSLAKTYVARRWHDDYAGRGEDDPVHAHRIGRDGWTLVAAGDPGPHSNGSVAWDFRSPEIYERASPSGLHRLRRLLKAIYRKNGRWYVEDFEVATQEGAILRVLADCDWADWQANGDLLFASDGCLYRIRREDVAQQASDPLNNARLIANLGSNAFKMVAAPASALVWP